MLIISGQMVSGVITDNLSHPDAMLWIQLISVVIIVSGIWLSKVPLQEKHKQPRLKIALK